MKHKYILFGYYVESEIMLDAYEADFDQPDVRIEIGLMNSQLTKLEKGGCYFSTKDNSAGFRVPQIGAYEISDGKNILITPEKSASDSEIQLYLLGFAFGLSMLQRGVFPLHGSTVDIGSSCLTLVGHSGAGKSSLASGFIERGFRLLTDDVSRIGLINGIHHVYPSYPSQKIWKDAVAHMGIEYDPQKRVTNRVDKFYVNNRSRFSVDAKPIKAVVEIYPADVNKPSLVQFKKADALNTLLTHNYCHGMMGKNSDLSAHLSFCTELVMSVPVYRLLRPNEGFTVRAQVDVLLEYFGKVTDLF